VSPARSFVPYLRLLLRVFFHILSQNRSLSPCDGHCHLKRSFRSPLLLFLTLFCRLRLRVPLFDQFRPYDLPTGAHRPQDGDFYLLQFESVFEVPFLARSTPEASGTIRISVLPLSSGLFSGPPSQSSLSLVEPISYAIQLFR